MLALLARPLLAPEVDHDHVFVQDRRQIDAVELQRVVQDGDVHPAIEQPFLQYEPSIPSRTCKVA